MPERMAHMDQPDGDVEGQRRHVQAYRDEVADRLAQKEQLRARYRRELEDKRHLLAYAMPEDDALEIAKTVAMIPVYEQTIARLGPEIRDSQQELVVAEQMLQRLIDRE